MALVKITIPSLLARMLGVQRCFDVSGDSIHDALNVVVRLCPGLGVHLFDESGSLRRLLLCARNGVIVDRSDLSAPVLEGGDEILLLASIAGG